MQCRRIIGEWVFPQMVVHFFMSELEVIARHPKDRCWYLRCDGEDHAECTVHGSVLEEVRLVFVSISSLTDVRRGAAAHSSTCAQHQRSQEKQRRLRSAACQAPSFYDCGRRGVWLTQRKCHFCCVSDILKTLWSDNAFLRNKVTRQTSASFALPQIEPQLRTTLPAPCHTITSQKHV